MAATGPNNPHKVFNLDIKVDEDGLIRRVHTAMDTAKIPEGCPTDFLVLLTKRAAASLGVGRKIRFKLSEGFAYLGMTLDAMGSVTVGYPMEANFEREIRERVHGEPLAVFATIFILVARMHLHDAKPKFYRVPIH